MAATAGPRYAPEDTTLPKPWRGLVDGTTGYLYYWNPETNVTQYENPGAPSQGGSIGPRKSPSVSISSSVQVQQSSQGQRCDSSTKDDDDRYTRSSNGGSTLDSGSRNYQNGRSKSDHSDNIPNGSVGVVLGRSSGRSHGSSAVGSVSAESYRHRHEITVTGDSMHPPFTSFEETGLPSEILREVRY